MKVPTNQFYKNLALWMVIGLIIILLFNLFQANQPSREEIVFSDFLRKVETGEVREVTIKGNLLAGRLADGSAFRTYTVDYPDMVKMRRRVKNIEREWRFCYPTAVAYDKEQDIILVVDCQRGRFQIADDADPELARLVPPAEEAPRVGQHWQRRQHELRPHRGGDAELRP